jgi:hypothetical protein
VLATWDIRSEKSRMSNLRKVNRPVNTWATRQKDDVFSYPKEGKQGREDQNKQVS